MIYKVLYQENGIEPAIRENTKALYIEADSVRSVRSQLRDNTSYLVEYIEALDDAHLAYEKEHADFTLTEFDH
ncbi:MAG: DNA-dependent RNA polymerase subunit epsilon [Aerococcus sp.]|nr:DNA-dependent RNA polymerase subunit epsilon [Aerococcus sp.]